MSKETDQQPIIQAVTTLSSLVLIILKTFRRQGSQSSPGQDNDSIFGSIW
jgi:hypothetical protein